MTSWSDTIQDRLRFDALGLASSADIHYTFDPCGWVGVEVVSKSLYFLLVDYLPNYMIVLHEIDENQLTLAFDFVGLQMEEGFPDQMF